MTMGKVRSAAPRWPRRAAAGVTSVRQATLLALFADVVYRVAIRSRVRKAIGI
jgi:hypothetical protein